MDGFMGEVIIYQRALSATERRRIESYLATKWGITLAPQVANADAQAWISRVYANGGTVSTATANAVNTFCNDIESAGIRDRFYRLNLFAGTGLSAALVPLYRGPDRTGTQTGGTTDTNNGPFVTGDYSETTGLQGNGTSKWLDTGLAPDGLDTLATGHVSARFSDGATGSSGVGVIGASVTSGQRYGIVTILATPETRGFWGGVTANDRATIAHVANNHCLATRTSATDLAIYRDGTNTASFATSITPAASSAPFGVFAILGASSARNTAFNVYSGRVTAYSIGRVMTSTQAQAFNTALTAFNTAISRT
jgi:hypothetical protein